MSLTTSFLTRLAAKSNHELLISGRDLFQPVALRINPSYDRTYLNKPNNISRLFGALYSEASTTERLSVRQCLTGTNKCKKEIIAAVRWLFSRHGSTGYRLEGTRTATTLDGTAPTDLTILEACLPRACPEVLPWDSIQPTSLPRPYPWEAALHTGTGMLAWVLPKVGTKEILGR